MNIIWPRPLVKCNTMYTWCFSCLFVLTLLFLFTIGHPYEPRPPITGIQCPDNKTQCLNGNTCCEMADGKSYECCPLENAVCCPDHLHCCPEKKKCGDDGNCFSLT